MGEIVPIRKTLGMGELEQFRAFVEWEQDANPEKTHVAAWALSEIERLRGVLIDVAESKPLTATSPQGNDMKTRDEIDKAIQTLSAEMQKQGYTFVIAYATPERELIFTNRFGHDFDIVGMCELVKDMVATSRRERLAEMNE